MPWLRRRQVAELHAELAEGKAERLRIREDLELVEKILRAELGIRLDDYGPVPPELVTAISSAIPAGGQVVRLHAAGREWTAIIDRAGDPDAIWRYITAKARAAS